MAKIDLIALAAAKKYTKDTADSLGSLVGAPCTIKSITDITGGHRITFEWTGTSGTTEESTLDVMDGEKGTGIKSIAKTATVENVDTYTITYDDDTTETFNVTNGLNGQGVAEGGTTGQILKKKSNTDFDTEWVDPAGETSTLDGLTDVNLGTLEDGQVLKYDAASGKWVNGAGGVVEVSMSDIKDVDLTSVADGDILVYDAASHKWVNSLKLSTLQLQVSQLQASVLNKVDKVEGKGLSENDYTDADKAIVDGVTSALADKVDKVQGKGLSTNDYTDADKAEVAKVADKADAEDVIDGASYDSTNHLILFKNGTTTLFSLDAAAFVKDGMVDTVTITGGNLVITFNTDAGKQAISIPLTDIFDPANYYDKDDIDGLLADKADKTDVDSAIAGQQSLLKDTVGWTGKNLLKNTATSRTTNGVTFTVNADKSVTVDGTATASVFLDIPISLPIGEYVFSGTNNQSDSSPNKYYARLRKSGGIQFATSEISPLPVQSVNGSEIKFNVLQDNLDIRYQICIYPAAGAVSNLTFYPMIRRADILDDTYEPYHESVETMYEEEIHGVNLLKITAVSKTENDITFTVNAGGSITVNGTATANTYLRIGSILDKVDSSKKYILSGCPSNGSLSSYFQYVSYQPGNGNLGNDIGNGITFQPSVSGVTFTSLAIYIYIKSGQTVNNLVFKPMIRKAEIEDSTYRPYNHQAIQNQLNAQGVLGAKNLLKNTATSQTINGITFAVNADGSVTANGTATAVANFNISLSISDKLSCILNGCPSGGSDNSYRIGARYNNSGTLTYNYDTGSGCGINDISIVDRVFVQIANGQTVNNLVFRPMLRLASDPDDTYVPYAPTNAKLNEEKMSYADNGVLGAKNLLPYPFYQTTRTTNGITFTDNGDGTITANGTATADAIFHCLTHITGTTFYQSLAGKAVILSGCPAGGANNKYYFGIYDTSAHNDVGEGLTYQVLDTPPSSFYIQIVIRSGITVNNLIFKPMLRLASDPDDTYVPYAPTNRECMSYRTNGVLGAKNLIPFPYKESSTTKSGTTYTVNSDGSITLSTDAQGATAQSYITLADQGVPGLREKLLLCKQLTLSGGKSASIWLNINNPGALGNNKDSGKGVTVPFTNTSNLFNIALVVERGTIITTPVTVYPLLRLASDPDDTYQPYAMTNRELTEKVIIKDVSGYSWDSAIDGNKEVIVKRYGAIVSIYGYFRSTNALAQYANVLSGLPHCASGAALSGDALRSMGMTLSNVDSATSKITVNSATTANLQYTFNFVYLTDAN